ncbi:MAG: hypothetical protein P4N24_09210 [Acidobacteriota bacterium]|nr:hypothetical protein [Acidobacteriota bacterium]
MEQDLRRVVLFPSQPLPSANPVHPVYPCSIAFIHMDEENKKAEENLRRWVF